MVSGWDEQLGRRLRRRPRAPRSKLRRWERRKVRERRQTRKKRRDTFWSQPEIDRTKVSGVGLVLEEVSRSVGIDTALRTGRCVGLANFD